MGLYPSVLACKGTISREVAGDPLAPACSVAWEATRPSAFCAI
jgi:hypothetical protein